MHMAQRPEEDSLHDVNNIHHYPMNWRKNICPGLFAVSIISFFSFTTNCLNVLSLCSCIKHEMSRNMKNVHRSWITWRGMLEDRSILIMTCTSQSMVLLTHTENTDIFTILFLKPSGTGKMGDHLANISMVAENCQSKNPHFEGIIYYYFYFYL